MKCQINVSKMSLGLDYVMLINSHHYKYSSFFNDYLLIFCMRHYSIYFPSPLIHRSLTLG